MSNNPLGPSLPLWAGAAVPATPQAQLAMHGINLPPPGAAAPPPAAAPPAAAPPAAPAATKVPPGMGPVDPALWPTNGAFNIQTSGAPLRPEYWQAPPAAAPQQSPDEIALRNAMLLTPNRMGSG